MLTKYKNGAVARALYNLNRVKYEIKGFITFHFSTVIFSYERKITLTAKTGLFRFSLLGEGVPIRL